MLLVSLPYRMSLACLKKNLCIYFGGLRKTTKNPIQENRFSYLDLKQGPRDCDVLTRPARRPCQVLMFKVWREEVCSTLRWLCTQNS
jgi:hypothetical protein